MGSGSSKEVAGLSFSSSSSSRGSRSRCARRRGGARAFAFSCFRASSTLTHDQPEEQNGRSESNSCTNEAESKANQEDHESCRILRVSQVSKFPSLCASDIVNDGESQAGTSQTDSSASSRHNMHSSAGRSSSHSSRYRPRFGFISDGFGFSLNRAVSLGSSGVHSFFSSSLSESNCDTGDRVCNEYDSSMNSRNGTQVNVTMDAISPHEVVGNGTSIAPSVGECSQQSHSETESFVRRRSSRQLGHQEHLEGSARFSRTRSVGRLRDRVLRRTSNTEGLFGPMLLEYHSAGYRGQLNGRRASGHISRTPSSSSNRVNEGELLSDSSSNTPSLVTSFMEGNLGYHSETSQHREATDRHTLEHRSAFLERRRRIRSQVRALQRLGSRFENLSGHDRSCILSGQHRTGRCVCRTSNRTANLDDDTSTRASISRIVMLAEALFDVLDEIHQQSVVLSSQPSFSSIGSVPAPKEVVECMPVKAYMKPQKYQNEEAAQCYICLVEYEEGDLIRMLPCHHEFHQMCIDKWLKEIHRVCPLCRGDVCRSEFTSMEKF